LQGLAGDGTRGWARLQRQSTGAPTVSTVLTGRKSDSLIAEFGQVGDDRLLAMAALMIADELFDAREAIKEASD